MSETETRHSHQARIGYKIFLAISNDYASVVTAQTAAAMLRARTENFDLPSCLDAFLADKGLVDTAAKVGTHRHIEVQAPLAKNFALDAEMIASVTNEIKQRSQLYSLLTDEDLQKILDAYRPKREDHHIQAKLTILANDLLKKRQEGY